MLVTQLLLWRNTGFIRTYSSRMVTVQHYHDGEVWQQAGMVTWSIKLRVHTLNHKQEANQVNLSLCKSLNLQNLEEETKAEAIEEGFFLVYTSSFPNCVLAPRTPISGGNPACSELGFPSSIIKQEHVAQACPWDIMEGAFTQLGLPLAKWLQLVWSWPEALQHSAMHHSY